MLLHTGKNVRCSSIRLDRLSVILLPPCRRSPPFVRVYLIVSLPPGYCELMWNLNIRFIFPCPLVCPRLPFFACFFISARVYASACVCLSMLVKWWYRDTAQHVLRLHGRSVLGGPLRRVGLRGRGLHERFSGHAGESSSSCRTNG